MSGTSLPASGTYLRRPWIACLIAGVALFGAVSASDARYVTPLGGGRVSVTAQSTPLATVLEEISALMPIELNWLDESLRSKPVTIVLDAVPQADVLAQLFTKLGIAHAIGGLKGRPAQVFIGNPAGLVPSTSPPGSEAPLRELAEVIEPEPSFEEPVIDSSTQDESSSDTDADDEAGSQNMRAGLRVAGLASRPPNPRPPDISQMDPHSVLDHPNYVMVGESVYYKDPNFIPYKLRPEVVRRRMSVNVADIP